MGKNEPTLRGDRLLTNNTCHSKQMRTDIEIVSTLVQRMRDLCDTNDDTVRKLRLYIERMRELLSQEESNHA